MENKRLEIQGTVYTWGKLMTGGKPHEGWIEKFGAIELGVTRPREIKLLDALWECKKRLEPEEMQ